jgi:hypothetical protein
MTNINILQSIANKISTNDLSNKTLINDILNTINKQIRDEEHNMRGNERVIKYIMSDKSNDLSKTDLLFFKNYATGYAIGVGLYFLQKLWGL